MPSRRVRLAARPAAAAAIALASLGSLVFAALAVGACSGPPSPKGEGASCFVVEDCAEGLVCVMMTNGIRTCSKDLTPIVSMLDATAGDSAPLPMALPQQGDDAAPE